MHSRILLFLFFAFSLSASAQFTKGTRMIGTNIATGLLTTGTTEYTYPSTTGFKTDDDNFSLSITPSYGVFLNASTVFGFSLLVNSSYQKSNEKTLADTIYKSSKSSATDLGAGVFLRYYFGSAKTLSPFVQVYVNSGTGFGKNSGFSFGTTGSEIYKDSYTGKTTGKFFFNTGVNLGITKMISRQVGVEAFVGYLYSISNIKTETTALRDYAVTPDDTRKFEPTQKFHGSGVSLGVGIQFFLEKK
jgi:hypothetical protein